MHNPETGRVAVVTGASAGIGRAVARELGRRHYKIGLVARGQSGLEAAEKDVENGGGEALAIATDVADFGQVESAAKKVEDAFGPIDLWINAAFTSVFAPFVEIDSLEFKRVTEVSYLGFVYGTMAALSRMKPRDCGTIVQVGSALGARSIPLQSAYCGAKHAINGFTESVRCELLHDQSNVRITLVQMPAVNTPQFSWVLSRLPNDPQPVPPIYQPELVAGAVLYAADHPKRKQYWVGDSTAATLTAQKLAPALLDRYLGRNGYASQQTNQKADPNRPANLWEPVDRFDGSDRGAHGSFDAKSHTRSPEVWVSQHLRPVLGSAVAAAAIAAASLRRFSRR
jgi:short-subunit dehydrogenase